MRSASRRTETSFSLSESEWFVLHDLGANAVWCGFLAWSENNEFDRWTAFNQAVSLSIRMREIDWLIRSRLNEFSPFNSLRSPPAVHSVIIDSSSHSDRFVRDHLSNSNWVFDFKFLFVMNPFAWTLSRSCSYCRAGQKLIRQILAGRNNRWMHGLNREPRCTRQVLWPEQL